MRVPRVRLRTMMAAVAFLALAVIVQSVRLRQALEREQQLGAEANSQRARADRVEHARRLAEAQAEWQRQVSLMREHANSSDPTKVPSVGPERLQYPDLESDAAFAGTWQLVQKSGSEGGTKVGDRLVVEERIVEFRPDGEGPIVWEWHEPGPRQVVFSHWSRVVDWKPTRTPAKPWPVIELKRGPSVQSSRVQAVYHLRGDLLWLAFSSRDGRLPDDFTICDGRDIEVWRRVAPPVTRLEPESALDGRWRLASVEFHTTFSGGRAANNASVPEHLVGTSAPSWFLKGKEGTVFQVKDAVWREEEREHGKGGGPAWTVTRELKLPRRFYTRTTAEPRPVGVPAEDFGTYQVGEGKLVLRFPQKWLQARANGVIYFDEGERIETYERLWD
jgi:hypothetical protein